jgi:hypothetical protein
VTVLAVAGIVIWRPLGVPLVWISLLADAEVVAAGLWTGARRAATGDAAAMWRVSPVATVAFFAATAAARLALLL